MNVNSINENLPLFKNMNHHIIDSSSKYENIKSKNKMPLSRIEVQKSKTKYIKIIFYINF